MPNYIIFDVLFLACCIYALWLGGAPERVGAAIYLMAVMFTQVEASGAASRFNSVEEGILVVDVAMLLALLILTVRAERFWPIWVTALHAISTAAHAVKLADPDVIRWAYAFALAFWSYPMLFLLALGTWNHQKRLTKYGVDKSWSTSSDRWDRRPPGGPIS
jgi:hypothetical protein